MNTTELLSRLHAGEPAGGWSYSDDKENGFFNVVFHAQSFSSFGGMGGDLGTGATTQHTRLNTAVERDYYVQLSEERRHSQRLEREIRMARDELADVLGKKRLSKKGRKRLESLLRSLWV